VQVQVALAGQRLVQDRLLEDDAADRPGGARVAGYIETGQPCPSAAGLEGGRQHPDGGGLAGAVRAEQAEHFTGRDLEIDAADGLDPAGIGLGQTADFHGGPGVVLDGAQSC